MSDMTGRERLLNAFFQQPVDRIPVAPFIHVNYVKEFYGDHDVDWVEKTPEVYRHFGRLGLGAVFGSKKLKALVISGSKSFKIEKPAAYQKIYDKI